MRYIAAVSRRAPACVLVIMVAFGLFGACSSREDKPIALAKPTFVAVAQSRSFESMRRPGVAAAVARSLHAIRADAAVTAVKLDTTLFCPIF